MRHEDIKAAELLMEYAMSSSTTPTAGSSDTCSTQDLTHLEGREYSGWVHSRTNAMSPTYPRIVVGSEDNLKEEKEDTCTGSSWSPTPRKLLFVPAGTRSDPIILNSPEAKQPKTTSGKKTPPLEEQGSTLDPNPFSETQSLNGRKSGLLRKQEIWNKSRHLLEFRVTGLCERSARTLHAHLQWFVNAMSSGVLLGLENQEVHGPKQGWNLILKIRDPNFGVDIEIKRALSLTNLEAVSTSRTCSDGWTATRSLWKSKEELFALAPQRYGSPVI